MARPRQPIGIRLKQYFKRRSRASVILDFTFVVVLIALLIPTSRDAISRTIISYSLFQPRESKEIKYLDDVCYDWKIKNINTHRVINLKELKNKVLFINFWATWCPPCVAEMPSIEHLNQLYGKQIAIILISNESESVIRDFITQKGYTFPIYQLVNKVPHELSSQSLPCSFLISKNGRIVISRRGAAKWDGIKVQQLIERLIKE